MSEMNDYLEELRARRRNAGASPALEQENNPGWLETALANVIGGDYGMIASGLKGLGAQLKAMDAVGRESSYDEAIRNGTANTIPGDVGDWMIRTADKGQKIVQNLNSRYGTRQKYADQGLLDRITNTDYLTDPRGLWSGAWNGVGSSINFAALGALAPEVSIGSKAISALPEVGGLLGRGIGALQSRGVGAAIDKMIPVGAITAPIDAFTNASEIYDELKAQGYNDTEIASAIRSAAAEELPYDFLNSAIFGGVISGKLGRALAGGKDAGLGRRIAGGLGTIPIEMGSEYAQESMQQRMTNKYTNKPYGTWYNPLPNEAAAGAEGAVGAIIPGLAGAAHTAYNGGEESMDGGSMLGELRDYYGQGRQATPRTSRNSGNAGIDPNTDAANILNMAQAMRQGTGAPTQGTPQQGASTPQNQSGGQRTSAPSYQDTAYEVLDEVSDTNLDSLTERKLNALAHDYEAKFGEKLKVTSMRRHGNGDSWHDSGQAFDLAGGLLETSQEARDWLMQQGERYGLYGLDEYSNPSEHATGGHIHFSDHGEDTGIQESNEPVQESNPSDISDRQGGRVAQLISERTGIPADWIWAQMMHETGGFDSDLARNHHNYGGIKATNGAKEVEGGSPEGGNYRHFDSDDEYADYAAKNLNAYAEDGVLDAKTMEEFVAALHRGGYFTNNDNEGNPISPEEAEAIYINGMKSALQGGGTVRSGSSGTMQPRTSNLSVQQGQEQKQPDLSQMIQALATGQLPSETRKAIIDMAEEQRDTHQAGLSPEENVDHTNYMEQAIQNGDFLAIAKAHPQEVLQILMGGNRNIPQPRAALPAPKIETKRDFLSSPEIAPDRLNAEHDNAQGVEAIEDIRERLVSAKSSAADNGNKQLVDEINTALRTGDESSMREIANRLSNTQAQNTLTATQRGENVNENQNIQTATATPQKGEEAPTNQNQDTEPGQGAAQNEVRNPPRNTTTKANEPVLSGNDRLIRDAFSPIPNTASGRAKQSKAIRVLARQHNVSFPNGVVRGMELGYPAAIATAQAHLSNAGVAIPEGLGVDSRSKIPVPEAASMQNLPQRSIPVDETVENYNVASQATNEGGEKSVQNAATETTSQNGADVAKEEGRRETPSEQAKTSQNKPQKARGANEGKRGESEHKTTKNESDTVKKEYKYYMNERGVSPGAQPKGFTRFDEEDKGGRYGAIYYDHPLTEKEIADYELTSANQDESQEQANEKHHREKSAQNEGNKKAADEGSELSPKDKALQTLRGIIGQDITNKATGIVAKLGTRGAKKMLSNKAVNKSLNNGFTMQQHLEAAENIKELYEEAELSEKNPDRNSDPNIASVKRFRAYTIIGGEPTIAKITVKESVSHGHRIYTVELEALEKPVENGTRADNASSTGSKSSSKKDQQVGAIGADEHLSSASSIPQNQKTSNQKPTGKHSETRGAFSVTYDSGKHQAKMEGKVQKILIEELSTLTKNMGGTANKGKKTFTFKDMESLNQFLDCANAYLSIADPETMAKLSVTAWHGSPHKFDSFSLQSIGTGEGAQVHGWGLYFAQNRDVSEGYRTKLSRNEAVIDINGKLIQTSNLIGSGLTGAEYEAAYQLFLEDGDVEAAIDSLSDDLKEAESNQYRNEIQKQHRDAIALLKDGKIKISDKSPGSLFQVEIPDEDVMLDEQRAINDQPMRNTLHDILESALTNEQLRRWARGEFPATYKDTMSREQAVEVIWDSLKVKDGGREFYQGLSRWAMETNGKPNPKAASELLHDYGIEGITYDGKQDGRCYVVFDDQAIDIIGKFSANDEIRKILDGIKIVDNEELNSRQEKFSALGNELGCQIVWIDADPRLNGMHIPGTNVTLLNRKAGMSLQKTFWHETFHWIKANNDPLWKELLTYFEGKTAFTKEQIDSYREKYGRYDLQRDEDVIEELLADAFMDVKQRVPIMQEMAKENPSLAKKFVAWLKRMMDRFVEVFHNPEGKLTTAQRDQFVKAFGRLAASMVDGNKKKLFKTYNNGKRITFMDGEPLPELQFSKHSRLSAFDVSSDEIKEVRKEYEGTDQWMKAPNGKKTNLTEDQWLAVRTKAFKKWFGDWENNPDSASKIIDENGEPMPVAHGTNESFSRFDKGRVGSNTGNYGHLGYGFYFSTDVDEASGYGNNTMSLFLNIRKPFEGDEQSLEKYSDILDLGETDTVLDRDSIKKALKQKSSIAYQFVKNLEKGGYEEAWERAWDNEEVQHDEELQELLDDVARYWDRAGSETYTEEDIERISKVFGKNITSHKRLHISPLPYLLNTGAYKDQTEAFTKALQTDGYDGVIYGSEIVAFEPKQIKSATDNVGTFSTESDNIKYSFAGENAENAPLEDLERAKKMGGKSSPAEIYKKTGWFKGQDGKWRFEIPDNLNKINFDRLEKSKAGSMYYTLGEIYDNPKLYEAYPDLIRVLVGKEEGMGTVNGQVRYDKGEPVIVLNADKLNQPSIKTTLIHEIQHVIQQKEGFAAGGSPESVRYQIRERIHDILKKLRKLDNANELIGRYQAMNKAFFDYIENPDVDKEMEMRRESDRLADEYELFAATLPKKLSEEVIGLWNQKQNLMDALENGSDFELYRNLGGEQEAREVARRSEGATRLSKQNSDTQEAEKALNDALENATENQMKAYRNREKLDKEIRKQGGRPTEEQLEKMESYDKAMGETLSEAYDNYLWERDTADEMQEEMGTPTPHNDDAIIVFNGKEFAMSNENNVDNSENVGDNEEKNRSTYTNLSEKTRQRMFMDISANIDAYIQEQVNAGIKRSVVTKELTVESPAHRRKYFGKTEALIRDLKNREGDVEAQKALLKKIVSNPDVLDNNLIENTYQEVLKELQEVLSYGGFLYEEIALDRYATSGNPRGRFEVVSWKHAEAQHEKRKQREDLKGQQPSTRNNASASSMPETKFSINASDNSTPSLIHRIRNILSGTPTAAQAKEQYRRRMARMIEDALGIKIRTGKLDVGRPANGTVIYKPNDKVIRSLHAYDWENILPVASGLMAERLGIVEKAADTSEAMRNYISTWILTGATNNTSAEADTFHKAMREHPHFADSMLAIREQFQDWADKSVQDQMRKSVQWSKEKTSTWKERKNLLYEELVEELAPLEDMVKQYEKETGEKLEASLNPMTAFRLFRGAHGRAITMIEGVGTAAVDGLKANFPNVKFDGFKTLHTILNDIGALQNQEKQQDFATYCIAKHILDMHHKNRRNRLEQEKLEYQVEGMKEQVKEDTEKVKGMKEQMALYQGEMNELRKLERRIESNKNKIKEAEKQIEALKHSTYETPEAFTEENCEKYIRDGEEKYGQAQKDLVHFSNTTAAILADSGVISNKRYQELLKSWPNYVPLFRVFEENKDIDFGDSMKRIKGSMRDIVNPLESIVHNTVEFVKKAEKNKAKSLLADFARCDGTGWLVEEVDNNSPNTETVITFYENGQRKYLETDPSIVKAINNMDRTNSNAVMKFLHAVTSVARACFTMASPEFAFRNIFRDYADAYVYNKFGFISPMDLARGFKHAYRRDNVYYEWLSSGAAQASAVSLDRNYTQEMIDKLGKTWKRRLASKQFFPALLEELQKASEYSEYATRIAMYEKAKAGLSKGRTRQDAMNALIGAAFESRDLMDFSRHGKAGAFWNQLVPFANASIQGMNKFYRTFDFRNGNKKEVVRATARLLIPGFVIPALLFLMHHDDDWFKELPDWVKETHYVFKLGDTIIRIPKGSDVGIRFLSNAVEKSMAQAFNHDRVKATEYFMPLYDALPNFLPIAILPLLEASLNRSTFTGRNIVPQYQEKFTPKMQYGPYTTGMAKFLGEKLGIAPSKIDHVIAGYTGSVGMAPWKFLDIVAGDRQLDTSITELPLTRALTYMPYKNPQSVQRFYEELDEQTKLENEFKETHKRPEGYDPAKLKRLKDTKKQMSELGKQERVAINNPNLSMEERKRRQMAIQQKRIRLVEKVVK